MSATPNKTKEWFRSALVAHGVPLPSSAAKKEEYQRAYEEFVVPLLKNNSEFSSDDDAEPEANGKEDRDRDADTVTEITMFVKRMRDQNILDALRANGKNPGPVVGSTRVFYENMLLEVLKSDWLGSITKIEAYLIEHQEAREAWVESGLCFDSANLTLHSVTNGKESSDAVTNGNGNSENGYSDSDDDELLETASRASKSSRASSSKLNAALSPGKPIKVPIAVLHSSSGTASLKVRPRVVKERIPEDDEDEQATTLSPFRTQRSGPTTSEPLYSHRTGSLQTSSYSSSVQREFTSYEESRSPTSRASQKKEIPAAPRQNTPLHVLKFLMLFLLVVAVPFIAYYLSGQDGGRVGNSGVESQDDLDQILKSLNDQEEAI